VMSGTLEEMILILALWLLCFGLHDHGRLRFRFVVCIV
jgi:hypothetical protein